MENAENIWIQKFNMWKSTVKKGCSAGAGPGGIFCSWVGRNCNYNDCPRRSLEEIYVKEPVDALELELRNKILELETKNSELEKRLETHAPIMPSESQEENASVIDELRKIENAA